MAILAIVALCSLAVCLFLYHKKRDTRPISFAAILVYLNKVYINNFLKLIDPIEEAYLRQTHNRVEFAQLQALRIGEAREYFRKIVANATALQSFGYRHLGGDDQTRRWLAHRLINYAVPVKMYGRAGILTLFVWQRLRILRHLLISFSLLDLKDLVEHTVESYGDLKEAALMLARHSEAGIEVKVAARL